MRPGLKVSKAGFIKAYYISSTMSPSLAVRKLTFLINYTMRPEKEYLSQRSQLHHLEKSTFLSDGLQRHKFRRNC